MTTYHLKTDNEIIADHYLLTRKVTDAEVKSELKSLARKVKNGTLDDFSEELSLKLRVQLRLKEII